MASLGLNLDKKNYEITTTTKKTTIKSYACISYGMWCIFGCLRPTDVKMHQWPWPILVPRWRHQMEAFSALLAFVREIHLSLGQHSGLWSFFDVGPHKLSNKQSNGQWFETTGRSCDVIIMRMMAGLFGDRFTWTNAGSFFIGPLKKNFDNISTKIQQLSNKKITAKSLI